MTSNRLYKASRQQTIKSRKFPLAAETGASNTLHLHY